MLTSHAGVDGIRVDGEVLCVGEREARKRDGDKTETQHGEDAKRNGDKAGNRERMR